MNFRKELINKKFVNNSICIYFLFYRICWNYRFLFLSFILCDYYRILKIFYIQILELNLIICTISLIFLLYTIIQSKPTLLDHLNHQYPISSKLCNVK